uniref:Uncharacterized protein n=1 Tax=Plectus sambesii TaxID=2011161 RepID=A0A914V209_9BILA
MEHSDDNTTTCDKVAEKVVEKIKDAAKATKHAAEHAKEKLTGHDERYHEKKDLKKGVHKEAVKRAHEQHEYMEQFAQRRSKRLSQDSLSIGEGEGEEDKLFYHKNPKDNKRRLKKLAAEKQRDEQRELKRNGIIDPIDEPPSDKIPKSSNLNEGFNNEGFKDALS